jgi:hypothetical protein
VIGPAPCLVLAFAHVVPGDLDALARDWLTYWLLDMGRLGRVDFEQWIAGWPALTSSGCPAWPSLRSSGAARLGRSQKISQGVA